jgi:hypothetical protein
MRHHNSWSRAFWLCGTVKLWFEGGKKLNTYQREASQRWNCSRHGINTPAGYDVALQNTLLNSQGHPDDENKFALAHDAIVESHGA